MQFFGGYDSVSAELVLFINILNFIIMDKNKALYEMQMWQQNNCGRFEEYDTLWEMFRTVVTSSSWGTSEFGGPVWLMDFSLANLQKLFPDNPWLDAMEKEWEKGKWEHNGQAKSDTLNRFSEWFQLRAEHLVNQLGLGNVIIKQESSYDGNISFYGWCLFLDVLQDLVGGIVERIHHQTMLRFNFSCAEVDAVIRGNFLTRLKSDTMVGRFPGGYGSGFHYCKHSDAYGNCYLLEHFSETKGYVIPETAPEKFLMLIVNDLMECKAKGYGNKADANGNTVPYPQMKFEQYLDIHRGTGHHIRPTSDVFQWWSKYGLTQEIRIELPQIDAKYGEFWHRQFPPKQNWRTIK